SDLTQPGGLVPPNGGTVTQGHIQRGPRFVTTCETAHRSLQQGPTDPPTSTILRHPEFRDEGRPHPMRDEDRADDPVPLEGHVGGIRHELAGIPFEEPAPSPPPFPLRPDLHS